MTHPPLFPLLADPPDGEALRFGDRTLSWEELREASARTGSRVVGAERVAVWAEPRLETVVAALGALAAGVALVPINPQSGERELGHVLADGPPPACASPGPSCPAPSTASSVSKWTSVSGGLEPRRAGRRLGLDRR